MQVAPHHREMRAEHSRFGDGSPCRTLTLTGGLPDVKAHAFVMLKGAHDFEQAGHERVTGRAEHAHEALRRNVRSLGRAGKANGRVDVVAQKGRSSRP